MIEKNFESGYPFDSFSPFLDFVARRRKYIFHNDFSSNYSPTIQIILLYSLLTGIKVSQISLLKWGDILEIRDGLKLAKRQIEYKGIIYNIHNTRFHQLVIQHFGRVRTETLKSTILTYKDGSEVNQKHLSRDIRYWLKMNDYPFYKEFKPISTQIMYGRRVLKVHGYDKEILNNLKKHLKRKSVNEMLEFLYITNKEEEPPREIFEDLFFDRNGINNW